MADTGTQLYTALARTLSDVPRQRVAGAIMITDGEVHDMPPPAQLALDAPLHVLVTGQPGEADRRLVVKDAPSFGIVGKDVQLNVRVEDLPGGGSGEARLTMRKDGGQAVARMVAVGQDVPLTVPIDHGGPNVVELEVEPGPHELTLDNNRAALVVNGVRDRLKVLLVTGEPHPGERTWRNILKSDPSVNLIHFTILRPPEKQDGTPIRELSLIAFPIRELFDEKLDQFDLIIFDRYKQQNVLPPVYLENIARYVQNGGALLDAAGPAFGTAESLYRTPLGTVLPAEPTGNVLEQGYVPHVSAAGRRHPVTADLPGLPDDPSKTPPWGRWFLDVEAQANRGTAVMDGLGDRPLLVPRPGRQGPSGATAVRRDVAVDARLRGRRAAGRAAAPRGLLADERARPRGKRSARRSGRQPPRRHPPIPRARRQPGASDRAGRQAHDADPRAAKRRAQHRFDSGHGERPLPRHRRRAHRACRRRRAQPDRARRCPRHHR